MRVASSPTRTSTAAFDAEPPPDGLTRMGGIGRRQEKTRNGAELSRPGAQADGEPVASRRERHSIERERAWRASTRGLDLPDRGAVEREDREPRGVGRIEAGTSVDLPQNVRGPRS